MDVGSYVMHQSRHTPTNAKRYNDLFHIQPTTYRTNLAYSRYIYAPGLLRQICTPGYIFLYGKPLGKPKYHESTSQGKPLHASDPNLLNLKNKSHKLHVVMMSDMVTVYG